MKNFPLWFYRHFVKTACFARAGSLAFTTFLALVPLMVLSMNVLAILPISHEWQAHLEKFIFSNFVVSSGQEILDYLQTFVQRVRELSTVSIAFLMVTAVSILFSIENSLNVIWETPHSRHWFKAIFYYLLILLIAPLLIVISLGLTFLIKDILHDLWRFPLSLKPIFQGIPAILSFFGYLLVYKIIPNCKVPWPSAALGALVSALLFECAKILFAWYLQIVPTYKIVYGAIAALPIFLMWVYICWIIFLVGGVVAYYTYLLFGEE